MKKWCPLWKKCVRNQLFHIALFEDELFEANVKELSYQWSVFPIIGFALLDKFEAHFVFRALFDSYSVSWGFSLKFFGFFLR